MNKQKPHALIPINAIGATRRPRWWRDGAAGAGRGGMLIFDTTIAFEPDETAVVWARTLRGTRFRVCVTRRYAEQTWRIRYSEAEVTTMV